MPRLRCSAIRLSVRILREYLLMRRFWNLVRFVRALGELAVSPTIGAIIFKKNGDGTYLAALYRNHVSDRWDFKNAPLDRLGEREYKIVFDCVEWPYPKGAGNGYCPHCYQKVDSPVEKATE